MAYIDNRDWPEYNAQLAASTKKTARIDQS